MIDRIQLRQENFRELPFCRLGFHPFARPTGKNHYDADIEIAFHGWYWNEGSHFLRSFSSLYISFLHRYPYSSAWIYNFIVRAVIGSGKRRMTKLGEKGTRRVLCISRDVEAFLGVTFRGFDQSGKRFPPEIATLVKKGLPIGVPRSY